MSGRPVPRGRHARALAADYRWAIRMRSAAVRSRPAPSSYSEGDRAPVLIVPGVYETWHFLRSIADRLNADGHAIHTVPGLGGNALPIPESATIVARRLDELGLEGAVIVAHSKGGLIGKHALLDRATFERVRHIVAVATPFGGSSLARFTLARPLRAFRVADPVIRALGAERELNARITSIYPRFDHHIPNGSRLDGARNTELPVVGHFRILRDPMILDAVSEAVDRVDPAGE